MSKVYILLADGFEEIEGLTVVDLMRRARIDINMVSIKDTLDITGARGIGIKADMLMSNISDDADMLVLPGGMPGTNNLKESVEVRDLILKYNEDGRYIAAICAAPTVFGYLGLLNGRRATCYPGMEAGLTEAIVMGDEKTVVQDGNIITSRGLGTAIDFALKLIEILTDKNTADQISRSIVYSNN